MSLPAVSDAAQEFADRCYHDFFFFAREVLGYSKSVVDERDEHGKKIPELEGPEYGISPHTPHAKMFEVLASDSNSKMIQAPRGSYKSTLATAWILWEIVRNPNLRVLYVMETYERARGKLRSIRKQVENNKRFKNIWGDIRGKPWSDEEFTIEGRTKHGLADPTFTAGAVEANLTGAHYDIIILDDLVTHQNVTPVGLKSIKAYFQMVEPLLDPGGKMVVVGTRYSDADLYGDIERDMRDEFEIFKEDCGFEVVEDDEGLKTLNGEPKFKHLTKHVLLKKLKKMGSVDFCSQYLNRCLPDDLQIFNRKQFKVTSWQDWMRKLRGYILTDTAVSESDTACYSVVACVLLDSLNTAYLVDLRVGKWPPNGFLEQLFDVYEHWSSAVTIHKMLMERNALNKTFLSSIREEQLKRQVRFHITELPRGNGDQSKDQRIQSLQARFEQGKFWVVDGCIPTTFTDGKQRHQLWDPAGYKDTKGNLWPSGELVDQFIRFPMARFKDIPDALADMDATDRARRRYCNGTGESRTGEGNSWQSRVKAAKQQAMQRRGNRGGWMDRWRGKFGA